MIFKSKIFRRFLTAYLPVTLVPLIIISFIALWFGRIEIRDQTFRQLQIMADGAEALVLDYLNYLKIQTSGYSASKPIIDALTRRYHHTGNNNSDRGLNRYLAAGVKNFPECVEVFVLDVNGRVIASSDASNTGKDLSETDYFLNGRKAVYVGDIFREEETGRITWLVSCPVMDVRGNRLLAVLVSRINPVTLSDITTERKVRALGAKSQALRIGETGETYIVNRDNRMITESRFLDDVILKQAVDTEIVRRTIKEGETKAGNYPDYRGIPVDGASMVIQETGWIVISGKDYKESMISFQRLLNLSLTSIGVLIPLIFFTSWLLSRRLTVPITRLVQADRAIIQGGPSRAFISDHEIPDDELGEVMHTRNIMLTSLKEKEDELWKQKEELQTIIDASPTMIFYKDKENRFVRVNKTFAAVMELPKEYMEGKSCFDIFPPSQAEKFWKDDKEVLASGHPRLNIIEPFETKKGMRWAQTDKIPHLDKRGNIIGIIGFAHDITERKQAELMLRESNEKFIAISVSAQDAIIMMDDEGNISFWNKAAERIFGYSRKEAVGNRVSELIIPHRYRLAHIEGLKKFKETGKGPIIGNIIELEAIRKDGKEFPIELSLSALTLKERWCVVGIIRDISKRVKGEEELRLSYKMASLGQLTAGVFHEILNPINIISTHVQLLLAEAEKGTGFEKDLKSIQEEIKRVQDIADGLLRFSRKESVATAEIDVNQLIDKVLTILVAEIKYNNIQLFKKFDIELPLLKANADLLRQVFLNLIKNAIEAMANGGLLTISTLKCLKDEKPCLRIQFTDTGCGIPKEHLDKIFVPFFTTKKEGKGVGMGLAIAYTTIQNHGGSISVSSEVGKGSTFTIELPLQPTDQNKAGKL